MLPATWLAQFQGACPICAALELHCKGATPEELASVAFAIGAEFACGFGPAIFLCRQHEEADKMRSHIATNARGR